jgi:hypothetical protein
MNPALALQIAAWKSPVRAALQSAIFSLVCARGAGTGRVAAGETLQQSTLTTAFNIAPHPACLGVTGVVVLIRIIESIGWIEAFGRSKGWEGSRVGSL